MLYHALKIEIIPKANSMLNFNFFLFLVLTLGDY